ncbi:MAG: hypothetical protein AAF723_04975 [Pseudomonadota bacterium]
MGIFSKTAICAVFSLAAGLSLSFVSAQVEQTQFGEDAFSLGTLTPATGAMDRNLWQGAQPNALQDMFLGVPTAFNDPLHLELLRRVTLSPGQSLPGADNALTGQKLLTAARAGFYQEAASLAELVPNLRSSPRLAQVVAYRELMEGETENACARGAGLQEGRTGVFWVKLRFICYVRAEERSAADLTLNLLRRQNALSARETDLYTSFSKGRVSSFVPQSPMEFAILRSSDEPLPSNSLETATLDIKAAIARDIAQLVAMRERALLEAVSHHAIDEDEARQLLANMPDSQITKVRELIKAQLPGSLEQSETLGTLLRSVSKDWSSFQALSLILRDILPTAEPIANYVPHAQEIAIAAMVTGQAEIVEKWVMALAQNSSDPMSETKAVELLQIYTLQDINSARRVSTMLGMTLSPVNSAPISARPVGASLPLPQLVKSGMNAAQASGEGPAALVYLMALNTEKDPIQTIVMEWARANVDLSWMEKKATFQSRAMAALSGQSPLVTGRIENGKPIPQMKPSGN